jgi:hypothetical protein
MTGRDGGNMGELWPFVGKVAFAVPFRLDRRNRMPFGSTRS